MSGESVGAFLREEPDAFDALRDATADRYDVDPGAVEKDYWATEVLRVATRPLDGVDLFVFKGGTSLSKSHDSPRTSTSSSSPTPVASP